MFINYRRKNVHIGFGASFDYNGSSSSSQSYSSYDLIGFAGLRYQLHQNIYSSIGIKLDTQLVSNKSHAGHDITPFGAEIYIGLSYDLAHNMNVFGQLSGIRYERGEENTSPSEIEIFDGAILGLSYYF